MWVSTTPHGTGADLPGRRHDCNVHGNFSSCITDYNAAAAAFFAGKLDTAIADLHGAVTDVCGSKYENCNLQLYNNVHFTEAGKQFCAIHVAKNIAQHLGPKWAALVPNPAAA